MKPKLTFANVMSSIAVFLALGGTAIALKANSVGSRHIRDGAIKGRDVGEGRLKGKHLQRKSIGSEQIDENAFDFDHFVQSDSGDSFCDPTSTAFVSCGTVTLGLVEPSKALLVAGGGQIGGANASGECRFRVNGQDLIHGDRTIGDPTARTGARQNGFGMTAVTGVLPAQVNDVALVCNELSGDVDFSTSLSVLAHSVSGG